MLLYEWTREKYNTDPEPLASFQPDCIVAGLARLFSSPCLLHVLRLARAFLRVPCDFLVEALNARGWQSVVIDRQSGCVCLGTFVCYSPPRWPSGYGVRLQSGRSRGSNPACDGIFPGSSHTSDLKIGTPVATLPGALRYRVSAGTGWPGVSTLWLSEMESWICNFYLSAAARIIVFADPSLRYTRMLLGR